MKHLLLFNKLFENDSHQEENDLFEDLLFEYIEKYEIIPMEYNDYDGFRFDMDIPDMQYNLDIRSRGVMVDIECVPGNRIEKLFQELKNSFVKRVVNYGYQLDFCKLTKAGEHDYVESIVIRFIK